MDYQKVFDELKNASLFDLWRIKISIDQILDDQKRQASIKSYLKVGMTISYFDGQTNQLIEAEILEIKRTRTLVKNRLDGKRWNIPFYMINLENVDIKIHSKQKNGLERAALKVGDTVGYHSSRTNEDIYGRIIKLNPKRAQIKINSGAIWNVPYTMLYLVMDGDVINTGNGRLLEGTLVARS